MFIPIDIQSIRLNPRRGLQAWREPVGQPYWLVVSVSPVVGGWKKELWMEYENGARIDMQEQTMTVVSSRGPVPKPSDWRDSRTLHQPTRLIQSLFPQPEYIFEYEDPVAQCVSCGKDLHLSELQSDSADDIYTDQMCPHCGCWEAVGEIVREKISDAISRTVPTANLP